MKLILNHHVLTKFPDQVKAELRDGQQILALKDLLIDKLSHTQDKARVNIEDIKALYRLINVFSADELIAFENDNVLTSIFNQNNIQFNSDVGLGSIKITNPNKINIDDYLQAVDEIKDAVRSGKIKIMIETNSDMSEFE